ncbi:hypothetical protein AWQ21_11010 [Picosynechococcus sp. PCC 7003]|uniref:invasin domain 3-containing protein n=1 Tax=Picosynechococcus sp. PCC 7003 TaxID=374981 RepID=UPI000810B1CC|nr:invasin domain 3-containing protein [Picosynechococcus sp. PCC 7003]ANV84861.1 hypothetical protein AWQ21_11010 [Picosynechococcus sp. PCC 7003]
MKIRCYCLPIATIIVTLSGWMSVVAAEITGSENEVSLESPVAEQLLTLESDLNGSTLQPPQIAQVPVVDPQPVVSEPEAFPSGKMATDESGAPTNDPDNDQNEASPPITGADDILTVDAPAAEEPKEALSIEFVEPKMNAVTSGNATTVVLRASNGSRVSLEVNGRSIDPLQIGKLENNPRTGMVEQTWYGIILDPGDNVLRATASLDGQTASQELNIQAPGAIANLRLTTVEKRVPADGRSTVTVKGFLLDENGNPANMGGRVTLTASSGEFVGEDLSPEAKGFQVDANDGEFTATLQSSIDSGTVQIRATMSQYQLDAYTQVQFETALRPSLLTGVINLRIGADNTDYFSSYRDFLNPERDGDTVIDIDGSAFAIGPIGEWLLTAAYNGDRSLNEACETCTDRLNRLDQPSEEPYPIYGDNSRVSNLTPSQDSLFLRLERSPGIDGAEPDYIMWGSYGTSTEFANSSQEFSALSRQLQGAKLNYNFGDLQVSAIYSQGGESFQRDTLAPDGSSGFYFLTQRLVVPGSEEVYFELEELERPGTVIRRDRLSRNADYEIDYDRGTIIFDEPVSRTEIGNEGQLLVRRIIITYQFDSNTESRLYGGRLRYHFNRDPGQQSWLGATYFKEDKGTRDMSLYGFDAQVYLGENYRFIGEYAHSTSESDDLGEISGSAYRFELDAKFSDSLTGRAYYRRADTGFSNRSTLSFVPGQTRYGAELDAKLSDTTQLRFRYDQENNEGVNIRPIVSLGDLLEAGDEVLNDGSPVDNRLTTISAGILQKLGKASLSVDWIYRDREDRINPENNGSSSQLRTNFTTPITDSLRFKFTNQYTLSAESDAVYSDRTQVGLDWRIWQGVNLALNQNWYHSGTLAGQSTTSIDLRGEYKPWENTRLTGRYSIERLSRGLEDIAAFGIEQRVTFSPGFYVDARFEKVVGNLFVGSDGAAGGGASRVTGARSGTSFSVQGNYARSNDFQAKAGYEWRNTNGSGTSNLTASVLGKLSPSLTALADFDRRFAAGQATRGLPPSTELRLGLAYRNPYQDRFNALLRYEYRKNPDTIPETLLIGRGNDITEHLFAAEAIYAPNWQWEFYGKLGVRTSNINLAEDFSASSTVRLAQLRATHHLNERLDLTGGIRWLSQPSAGYREMGWLAEVGYALAPSLRVSVGYSSGSVNNDRDFSGSRSDGGFYAGAMLKLDNLFGDFGFQEPLPAPAQPIAAVQPSPQPQASLPEAMRLDLSQSINFNSESMALSSEGQLILDSLVTVMRQYRELEIDIQGILPPLAELTPDNLNARRLQVARDYLIRKGVGSNRIIIRSLSQTASTAAAANTSPITFALNASGETFALMYQQIGGNNPLTKALAERLPQLAQAPTPAVAVANAQTAPIETAQTINRPGRSDINTPFTVGTILPRFVPDPTTNSPALQRFYKPDDRLLATDPTFGYLPYWVVGFTPVQNPTDFLIAETITEDPVAEFATSLRPELGPLAARPSEDQRLSANTSNPEPTLPQIVSDRRLDDVPLEITPPEPNADQQILGDRRLDDSTEEALITNGATEPLILGDRRLDELSESELQALAPEIYDAVFGGELQARRLDTDDSFFFGNANTEPLILGDRRLDELSESELQALAPEIYDAVFGGEIQARRLDTDDSFFFGNANTEPLILGDRRLDELSESELQALAPEIYDAVFGGELQARRLDTDDSFFFGNANTEPLILGDRRLDDSTEEALITDDTTETQILGDRRLDENMPELLTLEPTSNFLSAREIRRLETALYFLLSEDLDSLDNLFQISGRQRSRELGQSIDLDRFMNQNSQ